MTFKLWLPFVMLALFAAMSWFPRSAIRAGEIASTNGYTVLDPIRHGNLTVFPVVSAVSHDTREFLTLDEGVRSGRGSSNRIWQCAGFNAQAGGATSA